MTPLRSLAPLLGLAVTLGITPASSGAIGFQYVATGFGSVAPSFDDFSEYSAAYFAVADTDESIRLGAFTDSSTLEVKAVDTGYPGFGSFVPGGFVTQSPHDFYSGDYAYAVGLFDAAPSEGGQLQQFMQVRLQGSNASVQAAGTNPYGAPDAIRQASADAVLNAGGLAQMAVDAGLWTDVNDYIEFDPSHALLHPSNTSPIGPGDWIQSDFPEPASLTLLVTVGGLGAIGHRRRK